MNLAAALCLAAPLLAGAVEDSNKALARRYFEEVWFKHNVDFADQVFAASYTAHDPRSQSNLTEKPQNIKDAVAAWRQSAGASGRVEDVFAEADRVVVRWAWSLKPQSLFQKLLASRETIDIPAVEILRFDNGKVVEVWRLRDDLGAQEELGIQRIYYFQGFVVGAIIAYVISRILARRTHRPATA